ncbi:MAG: Do family serine endopeptidase [Balneolaceae bacterium]|nr:Do family serine endopeptidase [Balneolaceae bacterium]
MKLRDRILTATLLILVGVLIGLVITFYQRGYAVDDLAQVQVTEVERSEQPMLSDEVLEKMDARFLFKTVAERVAPSVVYIEAVVPVESRGRFRGQEEEEGSFWNRVLPQRMRTVGSGVILSRDGYIVTNNHVVDGADGEIEVVLDDKRSFRARLVGSDPTTDIAVVKIDAGGLSPITVGNSNEVQVGEWVLAFGNPFQLRSTVTAGIVSALSREVNIIEEQMGIQSFIQTDAAINRGNSGGALVNTSGELIGVNTAIASEDGSYQGYGFAVPSNLASKVARDLIEYGEVRRALLGVTILSVNASQARRLGMDRVRGVLVNAVTEEGPAARAGLQSGDVVLEVNGDAVNESNQLQEKIAVLPPGRVVTLTVWRDGEQLQRDVELGLLEDVQPELAQQPSGERPGLEPAPEGEGRGSVNFHRFEELGFRVMQYTRRGEETLIISDVEQGREAERRGLKPGYTVLDVEGERVEDLQTMRDLVRRTLDRSGSVVLQIETRDGTRGYYELKRP